MKSSNVGFLFNWVELEPKLFLTFLIPKDTLSHLASS